MDPAQMMSTNAVTGSASLYSMPVMIMMTVETSQMSLAAVSTLTKSVYVMMMNCKIKKIKFKIIGDQLVKNTSVFKKKYLFKLVR